MITGLYETHIKVAALERSMHFYGEVLGLELGLRDPQRPIAFYWVGERNKAMLGLWEIAAGEVVRPQHFAFAYSPENVLHAPEWLKECGLTGRNFLDDGTGIPLVHAWMPAISYYFRDPDGHSLEFIAPLEGTPLPELGMVPLQTWQQAQKTASTPAAPQPYHLKREEL